MFGDDVTAAARARLGDRYHLMPYLYSLGAEAVRTGAPILRPLVWEFPDDPMVANLGDEAMLGPFVLAAPITQQGATSRRVYLPAGRWFELHSGRIFDGPTTIDTAISTAALPLYVRAGAILPTTDGIEVYPGDQASSFTLYEDDGSQLAPGTRTTIGVKSTADGATVTFDHDSAIAARTLNVRVHRVDGAVTGVDGAQSFHYDPDDRSLTATAADATHLALAFHYDPAIADPDPPVAVIIGSDHASLLAIPVAIWSKPDTISYPELKAYLIKYQDPKQADQITKVQEQLDETKQVMVS